MKATNWCDLFGIIAFARQVLLTTKSVHLQQTSLNSHSTRNDIFNGDKFGIVCLKANTCKTHDIDKFKYS